MSSTIRLAALLLFVALGFVGASGAARAGEVQDCSSGCTIETCNASVCSIWYCSGSTGCKLMATYPNPRVRVQVIGGGGKDGSLVRDTAYVKVCPVKKSCDLYEIGVDEAVNLGSFDNIEDIVDYRKSLRE